MALLALIIIGISTLIFSVVVGWEAALVVAAASAVVLVLLLVVVPAAGRPAQRPGLGVGTRQRPGPQRPRAPVVSQLPTQLLPVTW